MRSEPPSSEGGLFPMQQGWQNIHSFILISECPYFRVSLFQGVLISECPYFRVSLFQSVLISECPYFRVSLFQSVLISECPYFRVSYMYMYTVTSAACLQGVLIE